MAVLTRRYDTRLALNALLLWRGHVDRHTRREALVAAVRRLVAGHAYRFVTGPWRRLWVRRGLDPRADASTRCMQMIEFRMPSQWCAYLPAPAPITAAGFRVRLGLAIPFQW